MPDASDPRGRGPIDWGEAFAAMPPEVPPADAWPGLAARLDARSVRDAATTATDAALPSPARTQRRGRRQLARRAGWLGVAAAAAVVLVVAWPRHDAATGAATGAPAIATRAAASAPAPAAGTRLAADKPKADATAIALPKAVEAARKPRFATRRTHAPDASPRPAPASVAPPATGAAQPLDALYAESARLEALLALARDDRVASAGSALLAAELDAQVAGIDARLSQPGLDHAQRTALWQARVDALRQAAGFESTQRVLASQGDAGALLVSVD